MKSTGPEQTRQIGAELADCLQPGDVIALSGDLGAGKSELTRGIAHGLGIEGPVPSPSFTILNVYEDARIPLYHFDFYRLRSSEEIYEMGMDEWIGGKGVTVIEWPSQCPDVLPEDYLEVRLVSEDEMKRDISFVPHGHFRTFPFEKLGSGAKS